MLETGSHDPILRLDQFIHRQDEMIKTLKTQLEIQKAIVFSQAILIFLAVILLVYLVWK
jgi:hypothetical protein